MTASLRLLLLGACLGSAATSCDRAGHPLPRGPKLVLVDSIRLEETDSVFVGRPMYLALAPWGDMYVSDGHAGGILRFSRDGRLLSVLGRQTPDPIVNPYVIAFVGDSLVLVDEPRRRRWSLFETRSGNLLRTKQHSGYTTSAVVDDSVVWSGEINKSTKTATARWNILSDSLSYLVPLPQPYLQARGILDFQVLVQVDKKGDTLVVGFAADSGVLLLSGDHSDTIYVPSRRRRGVPPGLANEFRERRPGREEMAANSMLYALKLRKSGGLVLVHYDQDIEDSFITAQGFVSVVSPDFGTACVDGPLHFTNHTHARTAVRGDTVFVIDQTANSTGDATTFVKSYVLDTSDCDWIRMH